METSKALIAGLLGTTILVIAFVFLLGGGQGGEVVDTALLTNGARHSRGSEDAPVTIVEFSDFQCPACKAAAGPLKGLLEKYPEKVRLLYRHFPLSQIHPNALIAAKAAEAAAAQGKFWQMHDRLFEDQDAWKNLAGQELVDQMAYYAQDLGLDVDQYRNDLEQGGLEAKVDDDLSLANDLGLNSTPTFFVNGKKIASGLSLKDWEKEIKPFIR